MINLSKKLSHMIEIARIICSMISRYIYMLVKRFANWLGVFFFYTFIFSVNSSVVLLK